MSETYIVKGDFVLVADRTLDESFAINCRTDALPFSGGWICGGVSANGTTEGSLAGSRKPLSEIAVAPTPQPAPSPRKPPIGLLAECHNDKPVDALAAMDAVRSLCGG